MDGLVWVGWIAVGWMDWCGSDGLAGVGWMDWSGSDVLAWDGCIDVGWMDWCGMDGLVWVGWIFVGQIDWCGPVLCCACKYQGVAMVDHVLGTATWASRESVTTPGRHLLARCLVHSLIPANQRKW